MPAQSKVAGQYISEKEFDDEIDVEDLGINPTKKQRIIDAAESYVDRINSDLETGLSEADLFHYSLMKCIILAYGHGIQTRGLYEKSLPPHYHIAKQEIENLKELLAKDFSEYESHVVERGVGDPDDETYDNVE